MCVAWEVQIMLGLTVFVVCIIHISVFQPLGSQPRSAIYETLFSTPDETPILCRWWYGFCKATIFPTKTVRLRRARVFQKLFPTVSAGGMSVLKHACFITLFRNRLRSVCHERLATVAWSLCIVEYLSYGAGEKTALWQVDLTDS